MWIVLLVMCPFGIPFLVGLFMLVMYERTRFTWLAVLLTWKPLTATWAVLWMASQLTSDYGDSGYSIFGALLVMSPAILITLGLVLIFRDVVFLSHVRMHFNV
jgi:hypothetical protein